MSEQPAYDVNKDPLALKAYNECMDVVVKIIGNYENPENFAKATTYIALGVLSSVLSLPDTVEEARKLKAVLLQAADESMENCLRVLEDPDHFLKSQESTD